MADRLPLYVTGHLLQQRPSLQAHTIGAPSSYMIPGQMQMPLQGIYRTAPPNINLYVSPMTPVPHQIGQTTKGQETRQYTYEELQRLQGKHEKERNFQWQQQRLRDFQPASKTMGGHSLDRLDHHPPANLDRFIQNVFGQMDSKSITNRSVGSKVTHLSEQSNHINRHSGVSHKPRDWSELGDLRDIFHTPSYSGLPPWCQDGALVPPIYTQVVEYVTRNGVIDSSLLYPILLSSGLSRETLGHIWSLANEHMFGQLSKSGIYALLGMVALAQNACQITSLRILNSVQQPPVPLLNQIVRPMNHHVDSVIPMPIMADSKSTAGSENLLAQDEMNDFQEPASPVLTQVASIENLGLHNVGMRLANYNTQHSARTDVVDAKDEEFSDFQQATSTRESTFIKDGLPNIYTSTSTIPLAAASTSMSSIRSTDNNLMRDNDDRYSVFRVLEQTSKDILDFSDKDEDEFGDYLSSADTSSAAKQSIYMNSNSLLTEFAPSTSSLCNEESTNDNNCGFTSYNSRKHSESPVNLSQEISPVCNVENDDFGEFVGSNDQSRQICDIVDTKFNGAFDSLNLIYLKASDPSSILVENQSVSSLDLGSNLSRCGSVKSLDLKICLDDGTESRDLMPLTEIHCGLNGFKNENLSIITTDSTKMMTLTDRYSIIRNEVLAESNLGKCQWQRCLESCHDIVRNGVNILKNLHEESSIYLEVIESENAEEYLRNLTEVYKISRRIATAIQSYTATKRLSKVDDVLQAIEANWSILSTLTNHNEILPSNETGIFDFASQVLEPHESHIMSVCGVCLLDVSRQLSSPDDNVIDPKLTFGGRQYHASCANFWVNCVDSLLPALTFMHLKQTTFQ